MFSFSQKGDIMISNYLKKEESVENLNTFTADETRRVFAFFLEHNKVKKNIRREEYGYRTYDSQWKVFFKTNQIVRHKFVDRFDEVVRENRIFLSEDVYVFRHNGTGGVTIKYVTRRYI